MIKPLRRQSAALVLALALVLIWGSNHSAPKTALAHSTKNL
ncbi:MAG: hypothetical protein WCZ20_00370 [Hydrogenophaga sp.]